jgi:hypothetical protein
VYALALGLDGTTLYAGGDFATAGGTTVNGIAKWDGSAWASMGGGVAGGSADVYALAVSPNGTLYAGGDFTSIGGVAALNIGSWNGVQWSALGGGVDGDVLALDVSPINGTLYVGGALTAVNGPQIGSGVDAFSFASWNGTSWSRSDVLISQTYPVAAILAKGDGTVILGMPVTAGPQAYVTATPTVIVNPSTVGAYPTLVITGPASSTSAVYQLINYTSGTTINFNTLISSGEVITLVLNPNRISYTSTTRGNIIGEIMPGSDLASWVLQPGSNNVSFYAQSTASAMMYWANDLASLEDGWTK